VLGKNKALQDKTLDLKA